MIDIALKHWIYEACIDTLFDNIGRNFCKASRDKFKVGDKYRIIIGWYSGFGEIGCYNFSISYVNEFEIHIKPTSPTYNVQRRSDGETLGFGGDFLRFLIKDLIFWDTYD